MVNRQGRRPLTEVVARDLTLEALREVETCGDVYGPERGRWNKLQHRCCRCVASCCTRGPQSLRRSSAWHGRIVRRGSRAHVLTALVDDEII